MPADRSPLRRVIRTGVDTPLLNRPLTSALRAARPIWPAAARWGELRAHRVGVSEVALGDGEVLRLEGFRRPDWLTHHAYWHGLDDYEPEVLPLFRRLCRKAVGIVDAGANIGIFSILAARESPAARVFAFEPASDVFGALTANAVHNDAANVVCVRAALGARSGSMPLFTPAAKIDTIGSADPEHRVTWTPGPWRCEIVPVVSLDGFVADQSISHLDVVKIDVEGGEQEVLAGARETLSRFRPDVFLEILDTDSGHAAAREANEHLLPMGYVPYSLGVAGPAARDRLRPSPDNWNHLLTVRGPAHVFG